MAEAAAHPYTDTASERKPPRLRVSFPELVWDHWQWERELHGEGRRLPELEARYRASLAAFERREGELLHAYWSTTDASAAAVTVKRARRPLCWLGKEPEYGLHLASDWVIAQPASPLADVLHRCETTAIRASEVLRGATERISMRWLLAVAGHVLGFIDRREGLPSAEESGEVAERQNVELDRIDEYYDRAAKKAARIVYSSGMLLGLLWVVLAAPVLALLFALFGLFDDEAVTTHARTFFACYGLGALGAFVSVLSRMSQKGKFDLDADLGRSALRRLAAFRPVLGAVFGSVAFLIVQSGLLQLETTFFVAATTAFVAGFSERWTRLALASVGGRLSGTADEPPADAKPATGSAPPAEEPARPRPGE